MQFGHSLPHLLLHILWEDPFLIQVFLSKLTLPTRVCASRSDQKTSPASLFSSPPIHPTPKPSSASTSPCQWGMWTAPHISSAIGIPSLIPLTPSGWNAPQHRSTTSTLWRSHHPPFPISRTQAARLRPLINPLPTSAPDSRQPPSPVSSATLTSMSKLFSH